MIDAAALVNQPMFIWYQYFVNPFYSLPMIHWCALLQSHHYVNNLAPESIMFSLKEVIEVCHTVFCGLYLLSTLVPFISISRLLPGLELLGSDSKCASFGKNQYKWLLSDICIVSFSVTFYIKYKIFHNKIKIPTKFALFTF